MFLHYCNTKMRYIWTTIVVQNLYYMVVQIC